MGKRGWRALSALVLTFALAAGSIAPGIAATPPAPGSTAGEDSAFLAPGTEIPELDDELEAQLLLRDQAFISARLAGSAPLSVDQAVALRKAAADQAKLLKNPPSPGPSTFTGAWSALGPNPIVQVQRSDNAFAAQSGRIGALAIRKDGTFILGAAQGGIWTSINNGGTWVPRTDNLTSTAIGAVEVAPSNDLVVYAGTGEGALSGDSYFGNGILKSTDGGFTWSHVSGDFFFGVSTSRLAVDPGDPNHLYAAILRGRGGDRRTSPPIHSTFGIWESHDGAATWTLLKAAPAGSLGATDLRLDPRSPTTLYASFWSDKIYKSTDAGATWTPIMNGLPTDANFAAGLTRFNLGLSHPAGAANPTLYTGFDWVDTAGHHHAARLFKSTDAGANWVEAGHGAGLDSVVDYCGTQCFYDNIVETDPTNPDIVYAGGNFGYTLFIPSGGIFRSDDGGATWKNIGWDLHPDFHALAFDPNDSNKVLLGNDGGVYYSTSRGGRTAPETSPCVAGPDAAACLNRTTWVNKNGTVNPATAGVTGRTGLQIAQFTSIGVVPSTLVAPGAQSLRYWGGTQDNGTLRKSVNSGTWFDMTSGDGGQVVVDQTDHSSCGGFGACFVYGTFFGISLYRITDGGAGFFTRRSILSGINQSDRAEFYIPVALNQLNTNQLFTATFRLYRTDNAKAANAADVHFKTISPDLTSGCTGAAPNGARGCFISAIGIGGGTGVYTGSDDGLVFFSPDAMVSDNPTWTRLDLHSQGAGDKHSLPARPVAWIAVDRSNNRVAYLGYNGFNAATPHQPGHVFKTADAGQSWTDISGNLPDSPVNSLTIDPSFPNTLYAATDVGPMVTYDGGAHWAQLGTGFPIVAVDQVDFDSYDRVIGAGTHGRGAWSLIDSVSAPALVLSKVDSGRLVRGGSNIDYTLTLRNIGNAPATGVTITDPIPADTSFVSADAGGVNNGGVVTWSGLSVPFNSSVSVHLTVKIDPGIKAKVSSIVDDGYSATSAQGPSATGSPVVTPIAPLFRFTLAPASQLDGARVGSSVNYKVTLSNTGFNADSYNMSSSGGTFPVSFLDSTCTTPLTTTATVASGSSTDVCVKVSVPTGTADSTMSTATVTATSVGNPALSASGTVITKAVAVDTLVVDDDSFSTTPVDVQHFYTDALTAAGKSFQVWDLGNDKNLPLNYLKSFKFVVWFTGNSFPSPLGPYESELKAYLDAGGNLFLSGQDLLDQSAGTTAFVRDYLHVTWDGSETQNDKATKHINAIAGTLTDGLASVAYNNAVLGNDFEDQITPNGTAQPIFTDDSGQPDALSFSGGFKVVFLAFPFEGYGAANDSTGRTALINRVYAFFG
ncbi:MAG: DUF11 domain-containing protein [Chloroflexi bacterium]|nr:MAG: DUF11 domain-containing protein [Chloroflexota bacterium]